MQKFHFDDLIMTHVLHHTAATNGLKVTSACYALCLEDD